MLGASGFLGARIGAALEQRGFTVLRRGRPAIDFARMVSAADWREALQGIDAVVNAVGILREGAGASFDAVHTRAPAALFAACAERAIPVVQVSALGAEASAPTEFLRTKHAADEALLGMDVPSLVIQPSLVFGPGGASAGLFSMLATLPWMPLPGTGAQPIQPVHVDDVAQAVANAVADRAFPRARVAAVGPEALTLRDFLATLRTQLGFSPARFVRVPEGLVALAARLGVGLLDRDSWTMLQRGSVGDVSDFRALLGREPRPPARFVDRGEAATLAREAQLAWLLPVLRVSLALVWIVTGIVSAAIYPQEQGLALLAPLGLTGTLALVALYGASALDVAIGVAILVARRRRVLWLFQAALIAGYTALITVFLPEQWAHPFGPILKNLPMLAAILLLYRLERP